MTEQEKLEQLVEIMDCEIDDVYPNKLLAELDEWDSIAILSFIAFMDETFGKIVKGDDIRQLQKVSDLLEIMES